MCYRRKFLGTCCGPCRHCKVIPTGSHCDLNLRKISPFFGRPTWRWSNISPCFGISTNLVDAAPTEQPEGGAISAPSVSTKMIFKKICLHRWSAKFLNPQSTPSKKVEDEIYNVSALILKTQQDHLWTFWVFVSIIFLGRILWHLIWMNLLIFCQRNQCKRNVRVNLFWDCPLPLPIVKP